MPPAPTQTTPTQTTTPAVQPPQQALDPDIVNLTKAIRQQESGGDYQRKGASGEYGAYQWEPDTWAAQSKKYLGTSVPFGTATKEQQNEVAYKQVADWKAQGYNVGQIASMWNAGEGDPNAYINGNSGTNSDGVKYDTKAYAKSVAQYYQEYKKQTPATGNTVNSSFGLNGSDSNTDTPTQPKKTLGQMIGGAASNIATGVAQAEINTVQGAGQAVLKGTDALGITNNAGSDQFFKDPATLKAKNLSQGVGQGAGYLAPYLTGVGEEDLALQAPEAAKAVESVAGKLAGKVAGAVVKRAPSFVANTAIGTTQAAGNIGKGIEAGVGAEAADLGLKSIPTVAGKVGDLIKNTAIGKKGLSTLDKLSDVETQKFIKGKTFSETAQKTQGALKAFEDNSRKALQAVKDKIPNIKISGEKIAQKVNDGILGAIKSNAAYKGVEGDVEQLFKNPNDLINSGLLNTDEAQKVKGMVKVIKDWKDTSARGVLNLKEALDPFYTDGLGNSNKILRSVQSNLKDLVGEVAPEIKPALKEASDNIDKATEFKKQLGKDAVVTETKLSTIARSLKNPAANASKIKLIKDVESATGQSILPEVQGYSKYLELVKDGAEEIPTKGKVIASSVAKRLGIAGGIATVGGTVYEGGKKLLGL
jgi:hypothetical protein